MVLIMLDRWNLLIYVCLQIDINTNIESQGPIHIFLHKLTDVLARAESGDQKVGVIQLKCLLK